MKIKLQQLLCLAFIVCVCACASQQGKPRLKERPRVVRQMLEDRDFKVSFPMYTLDAGGSGWSFLGAKVPFYMQISADTLYSFMSYDVWTRPDLEYVYARPYKHGEPFPSKYIISDYDVKMGQKDSVIVSFRFYLPVNMDENGMIYPRKPWLREVSSPQWKEEEKVCEIKLIRVRCQMTTARNGDVSGRLTREENGEDIFSLFMGYFDFNHAKIVFR
mgnify:FL=1|nr:hypothetical protein [uncultured Butyricimonas sp.]